MKSWSVGKVESLPGSSRAPRRPKTLPALVPLVVDRTPRELLGALLARLSRSKPLARFDEEHPCVLVLSTGRAGTKTLALLLGLAKDFHSYHEPPPKLFGLSKLAYELGDDPAARRVAAEAFLTARASLLGNALRAGSAYAETSPQVTFIAPALAERIDEIRLVHLVRRPEDVVRSAIRRHWYDGHSFDNVRIVPRPESDAARRWAEMTPFSKNVWLWNETNRWIMRRLAEVPKEKWVLVRSEDVFAADTTALRDLFALVNRPVPPSASVDRVLAKHLNAQTTGDFPGKGDWSAEMLSDLAAVSDTARLLGYEIA